MIRVLDSAGSTLVEWGRQQQQDDADKCETHDGDYNYNDDNDYCHNKDDTHDKNDDGKDDDHNGYNDDGDKNPTWYIRPADVHNRCCSESAAMTTNPLVGFGQVHCLKAQQQESAK